MLGQKIINGSIWWSVVPAAVASAMPAQEIPNSVKFCPNCGSRNDATATKCLMCGHDF